MTEPPQQLPGDEETGGTPPQASPTRRHRRSYSKADHVIGAIRLALEAAEPAAQVKVIEKLLERVPATPGDAVEPVKLFLDAIKEAGGSWVVPS